MMHSRGLVLSENQAFVGQTRTPGPSRLHASPTRKNMTTGKRTLAQPSKLLGQDGGSSNSTQLFKDAAPCHSPVKALGDRNASNVSRPSRLGPTKQDASLRKGAATSESKPDPSSTKKRSSEASPRKASTSNALRSLNGKQRQTTDLPFTKPHPPSTNTQDASTDMIKTPAPWQLGKTRSMSRQNSFVTPAANTGRAGQIKARMGEIMDAELGLSLQKGDNATEQLAEPRAVQMTDEELYPEIEYMPPSLHAKHPVFEFPDELDDLPRAKDLGDQLSSFSTIGFRAARSDDLSDVELSPLQLSTEVDLAPPNPAAESDDDDLWPDVAVTVQVDREKQPSAGSRRNAAIGKVMPKTAASSSAGMSGSVAASVAVSKPPTGALNAGARMTTGRSLYQSVIKSNGLQRSIASAPRSRPLSSTGVTAISRAPVATRPVVTAAKGSTAGKMGATKAAGPKATTRSGPAPPAPPTLVRKQAMTQLNPKLIDFVDDELGKQTAATLDQLAADEDLEALQLDLGDVPEQEREAFRNDHQDILPKI